MKYGKPDQVFESAIRLHRAGRIEEAAKAYRKILKQRPGHAAALCNLGVILRKKGELEAAQDLYERSLRFGPDDGSTWSNLAGLLLSMGKTEEAIEASRNAIKASPSLAAAYDNLGNGLFRALRFDEAEQALLRALELAPRFANAWNNLGQVYQRQSRLVEAAQAYQHAVSLDPSFAIAFSNLLFCMHFSNQWGPQEIFAAHIQWARQFEEPILDRPPLRGTLTPRQGGRPRIGFMSPDLRGHPVTVFLKPLIAHWPHEQFELGFFSSVCKEDEVTQWFKERASHWCDIYSLDDEAAAEAIVRWTPDILIDLAGHTGGGRLLVMARRPAPVQMSWLGYFDTTGMNSVDYLIADPVSVPPEQEHLFSEKVLRLPDGFVCYEPPVETPDPGPLPALASGIITFGSQNQLAKITEEVIALWAELLRRVPTSRLLFQAKAFNDLSARQKYIEAFVPLGIDAARLELLPATSPQGILANYSRIDIALDPFPCAGGTTTCEALWMGVPVVTLLGDRFGGRHSASHINNVGLGHLIAKNREDYLDIASALAADPTSLATMRQQLREQMRTSPLCDGKRFAASFAVLLNETLVRSSVLGSSTDLSCGGMYFPATDSSPAEALQQAISHQQAGRLIEAEQLYRAILQIRPDHPEANHNLGVLAVQKQQSVIALPHFKAALEANPNQGQYWLSYIEALIHTGQIDAARQVLAQGRQRGLQGETLEGLASQLEHAGESTLLPSVVAPTHEETEQLLFLFSQGRHGECEAQARMLTTRFPRYGFGWKVLGACLREQGLLEDAVGALQTAVALLPTDAEAYSNLGIAFKDQGRLAEAEISYRRALEINPDFAEVHSNLGNVLKGQGCLAEAEDSYRRALALKPDHAGAHNNLGNILKALGRLSEAEACFQRVLEINPALAVAHCNLGATLKDQDRLAEAEGSFRRALEIKPDYVEAHNNLGNTLRDQGRLVEAEAGFRQALEINPDLAEVHNNLGNTLKDQGRFTEAEASFRQALTINPDLAEVHNNLGNTLKDQGRWEEALAHYEQALVLAPGLSDTKVSLCQALYLFSRINFAEARKIANRVRQLFDGDSVILRGISGILGQTDISGNEALYTQELFDRFAATFDEKLGRIQYKTPKHMAEALELGADWKSRNLDVLDAGCGTGLCGEYLRPVARSLVGVDLSSNMLSVAKKKSLYDSLYEENIIDFMAKNEEKFDLVFSSDVMPYIGDVQKLLGSAAAALRRGGVLAISAEKLDRSGPDDTYVLRPSGRYQHSRQYLERSFVDAGFFVEKIVNRPIRLEDGRPVEGLIVVARKP